MPKPLCFILMPFGKKTDQTGREINFDTIYQELIKPAIEQADMIPIRADEEAVLGIIHKPMFERLILCDYAIADLTSLNANVFYELGVRHAVRPHTTLTISAFDAPLPFDLKMQRTLPYELDQKGQLTNADKNKEAICSFLKTPISQVKDSPVFELVKDWDVSHNLSHDKTDTFREEWEYSEQRKKELADIRTSKNVDDLIALHEELKPLSSQSVGVVMDLFISYRALSQWGHMVTCYEEMDQTIQQTKMVKEQFAMARNRLKDHKIAEDILTAVIKEYGADPETNGLLGRVYKDIYSQHDGSKMGQAYLNKAIQAYKAGFDADWRDFYPGVNLVTLLAIKGDEETLEEYLPVVFFSTKQNIKHGHANYWDFATLLELEVINRNYEKANEYLLEALPLITEKWMGKTTVNNLEMIKRAREEKGEDCSELDDIISELKKASD